MEILSRAASGLALIGSESCAWTAQGRQELEARRKKETYRFICNFIIAIRFVVELKTVWVRLCVYCSKKGINATPGSVMLTDEY